MDNKKLNLLESFILDELTEEDRQAVLAMLSSDVEMMKWKEELSLMIQTIRRDARSQLLHQLELYDTEQENQKSLPDALARSARTQILGQFKQWDETATKPNTSKGSKKIYWLSALAASIVFILYMWFYFSMNQLTPHEEIAHEQVKLYPPEGLNMGEGQLLEKKDSIQQLAVQFYEMSNWTKAVHYYSLLDTSFNDTLSLFYLSIAQFKKQDYKDAIESMVRFQKVAERYSLEEAAQWQLALYLLADGQIENSKRQLKQFDTNNNPDKSIIQLLEKINALQ